MAQLLKLTCTLAAMLSVFLVAEASVYDKSRGFQTFNVRPDMEAAFVKHHNQHTVIHRHTNMEQLKQHPEFQRYEQWKALHKAEHPEAPAAFHGQLPVELLPWLTEHDGVKYMGMDMNMNMDSTASTTEKTEL